MSPLPEQPLSPLDGRYRDAVAGLGEHLSEAGLNRARVQVEVEWLVYLTDHEYFGSHRLTADQISALRALVTDFDQSSIDQLATLEATTRHDVKAVEYFVRSELATLGLDDVAELTHFAATSEDINNLSYALIVRAAVERSLKLDKPESFESSTGIGVRGSTGDRPTESSPSSCHASTSDGYADTRRWYSCSASLMRPIQ